MKVCGSQDLCPFKSKITTGGCVAAEVCPGYCEPWHWTTTAKKTLEEVNKKTLHNWIEGNNGGEE